MNKYWHFMANNNGVPIMRDGVTPIVGKRYEIDGNPVLCKRGYHGSKRAIDAIWYAPGPWVSLRELEDAIDDKEKSVGRAFVQTRYIDATEIIREFTRWCALQVTHMWDAPDVVLQYLETGDEFLQHSALDAARDVTRYAAIDAALAAARYVSRDADQDVAWSAAWSAACAAVEASAFAAVEAAVLDAQNKKLEQMLYNALKEAGDE